ncbi:MAG: T9SS C-terminal target domain-containing protein [Bacteroidales bacterium]|jgi:hypothetical protein|nr:T9SS C-terminal target domain-containing protein [Bacteroidales bacterium]NLB87036.1 T9SS C-terminal target domain-containing protein [Bacteroidales bacterium]
MKNLRKILILALLITISNIMLADKWKGEPRPAHKNENQRAIAGCEPAKVSTEMAINNVRALIHTGGDMWWDIFGTRNAAYEVPAGSGCHALFAGAIWVGGKDANGQLKLAAQRFRQDGIDYWPGPLTTDGLAYVSPEICTEYDRHFYITKAIVKEFREWWKCTQDPECDETIDFAEYQIPEIILNWPAHGPEGGYAYNLAPWWDVDGDGVYNPLNGDFPYYEFPSEGITNDPDCHRPRGQASRLFGDHTLWWVYNDKGNIHTETGGAAIGMEFRAQYFAFSTNDELNDMTFANYNIINRSTYILTDTYFGVWTDADLGYPNDDYTGCDVQRGLGYMYNGDDFDESASGHNGYGSQPPAIGIDFFEGPYQDPDGKDNSTSYDTINGVKILNCNKGDIMNGNINGLNFQDGEVDNERWGMRRFLYFNNNTGGNPYTQDPHTAQEHYNYLTGYWLDNSPLCYGGTGHKSGGGDPNNPTNFMFPGNPSTDPCGWGLGGVPQNEPWSEETENNPPDDRRFVQSAGPFTLKPGHVNDITIGAVYARAASGGPWASVEAVRRADDKAQILFENCFRVLDGPDAPELKIIELDKKFIFHIYNRPGSNNYLEAYVEKDPGIVCHADIDPCDEYYRFQGYQVFQYKDGSVSISDRYNNAKVRTIFQCDLKDDVSQIVNYTWSDELKANVPVEEVNGQNTGIKHTFVVEKDMFATGDSKLINNREYYFSAIAYGYNNSLLYNQSIQETFNGQKKPYLAGRNNIKRYMAIPHMNHAENNGTIMQSEYGDGLEITMYEGHGNANNIIELTDETIDEIMSGYPWKVSKRVYKQGKGPINVKIIDPLNVPEGTYYLKFNQDVAMNSYGLLGTTRTSLIDIEYKPFGFTITLEDGREISSDLDVQYGIGDEQLLMDLGLSITIAQDNFSGINDKNTYHNGFLDAKMIFEDETKPWLLFLPDGDNFDALNWIRVGTYTNPQEFGGCIDKRYDDYLNKDNDKHFGKILDGTWAPYVFTHSGQYGLSLKGAIGNSDLGKYEPLSSVDLVITKDKSKWTRSCVVEMHENEYREDNCGFPVEITSALVPWLNYQSIGNAHKFTLRKSPSVDKEGKPLDDGTYGLSWFPGYAIDHRTGERLNIVFSEDSWLADDNGTDMIWNPSSGLYSERGPVFGGKHYIYIMGHSQNPTAQNVAPAYDSCQWFYNKLLEYEQTSSASMAKQVLNKAWASAMWTAIPITNPNYDFLATDVRIKLRVGTPYHKGMNDFEVENPENDNLPYFSFTTENVKTIKNHNETAVNALDLIKVVPNPYYGSSYYEHNQLDNYVRITNLPQKCVISIYNSAGILVRKLDKDNNDPFLEWDMKNTYGITIASGVYIVHINAPGIGEKVVKWFGALRPIDLNNF